MLHAIDPNNFTYEECLELTIQFYKSFENDSAINSGIPEDYLFANVTDRLLSIHSPVERMNKTVQLAKNYRQKMLGAGWAFYSMIADPQNRGFLFYENGRCVGCSLWRLSSFDVPKLSWWQYLRMWIRKLYAYARVFCILPFGKHKFLSEFKIGYYGHIRTATNFTNSEDRYRELAHKSYEELKTALYPTHAVTYCDAFCTTVQRKGYGQKYFPLVLDALPCGEPVFKDGNVETRGPPKFGLTATEAGEGLYLRYGFKGEKPVTQDVLGVPRTGTVMFKVLAAPQGDIFASK